ncbi:MAG: hypothetical protein ACREGG_00965 [Candidatus Saccharimonadales bacterium]
MLDDKENSRLSVWIRVFIDFPLNVAKQNLIYAGGIMSQQTPYYVKRNSVIAGVLISPFFALVIVNSLINHALNFTNNWGRLALFLLVGLPAIAFILCSATFIKWSQTRKSFWKSFFDLRRNWLMLVPGGMALLIVLFVPFHDGTHCVRGNPIQEIRHFHQTITCLQRD